MSVEKICLTCGKTFYVSPSRRGKYCSHKCYHKSLENNTPKTCKICGKEFTATPSMIRDGRGKYCSRECYYKSQPRQVERTCEVCGKIFSKQISAVERGAGRFCSYKCSYDSRKGSNHPNWKGGVTFAPYCSKFNDEFKERVRDFWGRKCGICGRPENVNHVRLPVHHVNYEKMVCCDDTPPLFMALCHHCHGRTNHNRDYWEHVLTEYIMIWFDGESYLPK